MPENIPPVIRAFRRRDHRRKLTCYVTCSEGCTVPDCLIGESECRYALLEEDARA
jgi:hypothetical protein